MKFPHPLVSMGFGKDRCCSDGPKPGIPADHTLVRNIVKWIKTIAVDEDKVRLDRKVAECIVHGLDRCPEDIDSIDDAGIDLGNSPGQRLRFNDDSQALSDTFGELFGVIQFRASEPRRENHCCGKYGSGQASSSGFIATGFQAVFQQVGSKPSHGNKDSDFAANRLWDGR